MAKTQFLKSFNRDIFKTLVGHNPSLGAYEVPQKKSCAKLVLPVQDYLDTKRLRGPNTSIDRRIKWIVRELEDKEKIVYRWTNWDLKEGISKQRKFPPEPCGDYAPEWKN